MNKFFLALAVTSSSLCFGLEQNPWFGNLYEFRADTGFSYSYFNKVQGAKKNRAYPSNNYLVYGGLGFLAIEDFDLDMDIELARTPRQNFSFRSSALQARYRFLDDIVGDPVSLVSGFNIRGVGSKSVKDISSPYASYLNFEVTTAVGKEKTIKDTWKIRGYGLAALGIAVHGDPWVRAHGTFEGNIADEHRLGLFCDGYFGLGGKNYVNVKHFHGWGYVQHESIDLGTFYVASLGVWGELSLAYSARVFAHNYPEYEQRATINYQIPFSVF